MKSSEADPADAPYEKILREHARHPRHRGRPASISATGEGSNPKCGDEIQVHLTPDEQGVLGPVYFEAQACALCVASASLMTARVEGLPREEARQLAEAYARLEPIADEAPGETWQCLLQVLDTAPQRRRCIELPWSALENALRIGQNPR